MSTQSTAERTWKRLLCMLMAVVMLLGVTALPVAAAYSISVTGSDSIEVVTGKSPWYTSPQITVKNTGTASVTVNVYDSKYRIVKTLTTLKPGKSHKFHLKNNQTNTISVTPRGLGQVKFTMTANKYIKSMR